MTIYADFLSYAIYSVMFIAPMVAGTVVGALLFFRQNYLFYSIFLVVIFFNSQTSGAIAGDQNTIYYRGSGLLYLPVITWVIIIGALLNPLWQKLNKMKYFFRTPIDKVFWLFIVLGLLHIFVGLSVGISFDILIANTSMFPLLLASIFYVWGVNM